MLKNNDVSYRMIDVKTLVRARVGEFFFVPEPLEQLEGHSLEEFMDRAREASFTVDLVEEFFLVFGGLRDSAPFYGGDYFVSVPFTHGPLDAGQRHESEWQGAEVIHVRGNVNYLLLRNRRDVAFQPYNPERPITLYAPSFAEAIMKWLDEPRPFDYRSSEPWQFTKWKIEEEDYPDLEDDNPFES